MYLTPTVRTMRDDPHPAETVELLVRPVEGTAPGALEEVLSDVGADVLGRTRFDALRVELPETAVADLCELEGIEAVETTDVTRRDADLTGAGEDVEFDG